MNYKPLAKRVLLKELPKETQTDSGLFIPDSVTIPLSKGKVRDAGNNCEEVKANDEVLFDTGSGTEVVIDKETYRLVREDNVVMVVSRKGETV